MPILNDIMDHQVLGPVFRQGMEEGRKEGEQKGEQKTRERLLRRAIEKRFGTISAKVQARLAELSPEEWEVLFDRALVASSLEELFPS
jgi:predicted transposase YdaD